MQITLWDTIAEEFEEDRVKTMIEPIVIALVSVSVKQYLGNFILSHLKYIYIYIINLNNISTYNQLFYITKYRITLP